MKPYIIFVLLMVPLVLSSQIKKGSEHIVMAYIPIELYKKNYTEKLTLADTLNFRIQNNDTLVLLTDRIKAFGLIVPYEPKDSTFLYYYKKVAFNHKDNLYSHETSTKYWGEDIKIYFSPSVSKKTKKDLLSFTSEISKIIDSLNIYPVKNIEDSNYIVYYFGDYEYDQKMTNKKNSDFYVYWKNNRINRGYLKLDNKKYFNETLMQYKIRELFIQSLGYFKFIDDFECESFFADCYAPDKKLTALDREILRYHYSYGICKGTDLETFENQHKNAREFYDKTGHLINIIHPKID